MPLRRSALKAFTLIELLVVIAIIALLIAILLPALGQARKLAWRAVSLSNMQQLNIASAGYRDDNKGFMPVTLSTAFGRTNSVGWCTWSFGGNDPDPYWFAYPYADIIAADRQLNPYVYPDADFYAPPLPHRMRGNDPNRKSIKMEVFKDPSDKVSYQRPEHRVNGVPGVSSYEDVGTSYHFNVKWFYQLYPNELDFVPAFNHGTARLRVADSFNPALFVWAHDQTPDKVVLDNNPAFRFENGYGDINKGVMAFLDGHVAYLPVIPGDNEAAYKNSRYHLVFEDLQVPNIN